jgi:hypothetical protein
MTCVNGRHPADHPVTESHDGCTFAGPRAFPDVWDEDALAEAVALLWDRLGVTSEEAAESMRRVLIGVELGPRPADPGPPLPTRGQVADAIKRYRELPDQLHRFLHGFDVFRASGKTPVYWGDLEADPYTDMKRYVQLMGHVGGLPDEQTPG